MKTKRKGKKKEKKRRKKKQVLPGIELGTFRTPGRFVVRDWSKSIGGAEHLEMWLIKNT